MEEHHSFYTVPLTLVTEIVQCTVSKSILYWSMGEFWLVVWWGGSAQQWYWSVMWWVTTQLQGRRSLWDRRTCLPLIYMKVHGNVPNILEVMSFRLGLFYPVSATTVVCCILMQILCVVSPKKLQLLGDIVPQTPYWGSTPGPHWGTGLPSPRSPVSFNVPPYNPVRSTPLFTCTLSCSESSHPGLHSFLPSAGRKIRNGQMTMPINLAV